MGAREGFAWHAERFLVVVTFCKMSAKQYSMLALYRFSMIALGNGLHGLRYQARHSMASALLL